MSDKVIDLDAERAKRDRALLRWLSCDACKEKQVGIVVQRGRRLRYPVCFSCGSAFSMTELPCDVVMELDPATIAKLEAEV